MKTKPFNARNHKPGDKLVSGGRDVTDVLVWAFGAAGKIGDVTRVWCQDGSPQWGTTAPLEVLLPEPEKPREWWLRVGQDGSALAYTAEQHNAILVHTSREQSEALDEPQEFTHVREVVEPEEAKCARCDDTGCPECDSEWAKHQVRVSKEDEAALERALKPAHSIRPRGKSVMPAIASLQAELYALKAERDRYARELVRRSGYIAAPSGHLGHCNANHAEPLGRGICICLRHTTAAIDAAIAASAPDKEGK